MKNKVSLFLMSRKGYVVLCDLIKNGFAPLIDKVVIAHDKNMINDYYDDMYAICQKSNIQVYDKNDDVTISSEYCISIAWRWIIPKNKSFRLIVIHDSLLPKYRGFSPLVNMLINKEPYIGVTSLFACDEYDKGDIISQRKTAITYPIKITEAINIITSLFSEIVCDIFDKVNNGEELRSTPQKEEESSYSLWRDENDYRIDWNQTSEFIQQFIYSVGYPFKGASAILDNHLIRILDCTIEDDVRIENRQAGKVIFTKNGQPVIVCGKGLIKITKALFEDGSDALPFKKFRTRLI